jgi:hypothetical protein
MSDYRDSIHCRTCPEQVWRPDGGEPLQEISVIVTDDHRELASELPALAERIGARR